MERILKHKEVTNIIAKSNSHLPNETD